MNNNKISTYCRECCEVICNCKNKTKMTKDFDNNLEICVQPPFEPLFYIINKKDGKIMAVEKEVEHGYNGLIQNDTKKELNPCYIAKTFIYARIDEYDFTNKEQIMCPDMLK